MDDNFTEGTYVLITTEWRGVFAGRLVHYDSQRRVARLRDLRSCVYWSTEARGVFGLASHGPSPKCRISRVNPGLAELPGVTAVAECTGEALRAWESEPWD